MDKKLIFNSLFFVLVILLFVSIFYFAQGRISGGAVLDINTRYNPDELLDGTLSFSMKSGELLPADSIVSITNAGQVNEYFLSELVDEEVVNGNFYIEDTSVSGSGSGYGIIGEKEVYPEVDFVLKITESTEDNENSGSSESSETESEEAEEAEEIVEEVEEVVEEAEEVVEESEAETEGASLITGGTISEIGVGDIEGSVSAESVYTYELEQGQSVEIISSTQDIEINIEGNVVEITTEYSEIEQGFGEEYFGDEDYELEIDFADLGIFPEEGEFTVSLVYDDEEILSISTTLLIDGNVDESSRIEEPEEPALNETEANETEANETEINITEANETLINETEIIEVDLYALNEEELAVLLTETGTQEVKVTKSEVVNDKLIIKYEIGKYWLESAYNYDGSNMTSQINEDKQKFAKRLAQVLSSEEENIEEVSEYIGSYGLS